MAKRAKLFPAFLAALAIGLGSCASPGGNARFTTAARPAAGMGLVYLFRTDDVAAPFMSPVVRIDGQVVGALARDAYTAIYLPVGPHTVTVDPEGIPPTPLAPDHAFAVGEGQVTALGLHFVRTRLDRPRFEIETKQGTMSVPMRAGNAYVYQPFYWKDLPDIETDPLFAELRRRSYRSPLAFAN